MKSLVPSGFERYTEAEVYRALTSNRTLRFRYDRLSKTNGLLGEFPGVMRGSVNHRGLADIKRTGRFTIEHSDEVDWLNDRIRPWVQLQMPDGEWIEWPQGLFLLSSPVKSVDNSGLAVRQIDAYDQTVMLINDKVTDRYHAAAGAVVTTAVRTVLSSARIANISVTPSDKILPAAMEWEPGTRKLTIVNQLLSAINYQSVWFDSSGSAVCQPYIAPSETAPGWDYYDDVRSVIVPGAELHAELFDVPNRWVLYVSNPERDPLRSEYTNISPTSPTSTVSRGFTSVDYRQENNVVDQETLDAKVLRIAEEASQVYEYVTFSSAIMPIHEHMDIINLRYTELDVGDRHQEMEWSFDLEAGSTMKHSVRRLIEV